MISKPKLALSLRQPYAEQVVSGRKKWEYRKRRTTVSGRVYIYAARNRPDDAGDRRLVARANPPMPTGVLVGTVEVGKVEKSGKFWRWRMLRPVRLRKPLRPRQHPQQVWWKPF